MRAPSPPPAAAPLAASLPGSTTLHSIVVDGRTRTYWLHVPRGARSDLPLPLVLVFHGHEESATVVMHASDLDAEADRQGFLVAYPDGSGRLRSAALSWNVGTCCGYARRHGIDDVDFAVALARTLVREAGADSTRVFAAGFSAGGMLALKLGCERAETFAGVADVEGAMPDAVCTPVRPVSVLLVQGDADDELRNDEVELRAPATSRAYAASLESAAGFWAARNGCAVDDWSLAAAAEWTRISAQRCTSGRPVTLYTVRDNPHAWPGGHRTWVLAATPAPGMSASAIILGFFADRSAPSVRARESRVVTRSSRP